MSVIMIVEDNDWLRTSFAEVLRLEAFQVVSVRNTDSALKMAQCYLPDLILCDIIKPHLYGCCLYETLRCTPATAAIPFIFMTCYSIETLSLLGIDSDFGNYLFKPFGLDDLLRAVCTILPQPNPASPMMTDVLPCTEGVAYLE